MTAFEYDAGLADYKQVEEAVPYQYIDPIDASNNYQSPITIGVKWNAGDSDETKLEKIITQKYIALFPYSFEAWTEMRRTGYPKTLPTPIYKKGICCAECASLALTHKQLLLM